LEWKGKGENEKGVIKSINLEKAKRLISYTAHKKSYIKDFTTKLKKGDTLVAIDPVYYRPTEVDLLIGIQPKQKRFLAGKQNKNEDLVKLMIKSDMEKC